MASQESRKEERWVWGLSGLLVTASVAVIWTVFLTASFTDRQRTEALQGERCLNTATALAGNLGNVLADSRLALTILSMQIEFNPRLDPLKAEAFTTFARVIREHSQQGLDVRVVDGSGRLRDLGPPSAQTPVYVGDHDAFAVQVPYPGVGFYVGSPYRDEGGGWSLDLSLAAPPNRGGITALAVGLGFSAVNGMVASLTDRGGEEVSLYRHDGVLLYLHPLPEDFPRTANDELARELLGTRTPEGLLEGPGVTAYHMVDKVPLWVVVSRPKMAQLELWDDRFVGQLLLIVLLTGLLLASTLGVLYFLSRLRQLRVAQERLARVDPLTGLLNRRAFLERCDQEQLRNVRHPGRLSLVMLDLDHFKLVNDQFGHQAGDQALKDFSAAVVNTVRVTDVLARVGGEEFAVLMLETNLDKAVEIAERIRVDVAAVALPQGFLTTSLGVAEWDGVETFEAWFARADKALYRAKEAGRNRVEAAL
jgi:diguanylate cyclase (GGDEF)-like protein